MKLKDILKNIGNIASGIFIGQPIFADVPKLPTLLPNNTSAKILAAVATIEYLTTTIPALKNLTGPEKLAAAAAIAKDSIMSSSALTGAKVTDPVRFDLGVSKITDGWNDIAKSVEKS